MIDDAASRVLTGQVDRAAIDARGLDLAAPDGSPALLFPGSFNPIHDGHARMAEIAHERTGRRVDFELSVVHPDKPAPDLDAIRERSAGIARLDRPAFGRLWLTRAPTYLDKARLFPAARFVVGFDTLARIGDRRYYPGEDALDRALGELRDLGTRFLVFHRLKPDGRISSDDDLRGLHPGLMALAEVVPAEHVRAIAGIASRDIRRRLRGERT